MRRDPTSRSRRQGLLTVLALSLGSVSTADGQSAAAGGDPASRPLRPVSCRRLGELDRDGDGVLSASDPAWLSVRLFHDRNGDGRRDASELSTPAEVGVVRIRCTTFVGAGGMTGTVRTDRATGSLVLALIGGAEGWLLAP